MGSSMRRNLLFFYVFKRNEKSFIVSFMEIYELRYFLGVARFENLHKASEALNVSPASLSKAIGRLEEELSVSLFAREGRHIHLTDHGRLFQKRAAEIVQLEESTRLEISGHKGRIRVVVAGPEVLLSEFGIPLLADLQKKFPQSSFEFHALGDEEALGEVARGEAHLAISTMEPPANLLLSNKVLAEPHFQTVAGKSHPLYALAKAKKVVPIEKVLEHPFVSPNNPILGRVGLKQSLDGWRDDQFPRRVDYLSSSLKILEELVVGGQALAYIPDYFARKLGVEVLKISGCPYSCSQKVRLVAKNPRDRSWLNHWF
jgi:DNA-binding transcriptional LysR family regulator